MKTLILYATKYGATREAAERIAREIEGAVMHDLKQGNIPPLEGFDCVIIGSSVYAGSIRKEAKAFLAQKSLQDKKTGLFLCGINTSEAEEVFKANFSSEILQRAKEKSILGGIFDPKKANKIERFIMKIVTKSTEYTDTLDNDKIKLFAEAMKI